MDARVTNQMGAVETHGSYNQPGLGVKKDQGKPQYHFLPFDLMAGENRVWAKGALKYAPNQWRKGMPTTQALNACLRHLFDFGQGEDLDRETLESHLDHAICCIRMMQNTLAYHPALDDRNPQHHTEADFPSLRMAEDFHDAPVSRYPEEFIHGDEAAWMTALGERKARESVREARSRLLKRWREEDNTTFARFDRNPNRADGS